MNITEIAKNLDFLAKIFHWGRANVACDGNLMPDGGYFPSRATSSSGAFAG
jgi:hypothetical protein